MTKKRILYTATTSKGGSAFSLYHMARAIKDDQYEPLVLLYTREHSYIEDRLAESHIKTLYLHERRGAPSSALAGPSRQRDIGAWLGAHLGRTARQAYSSLRACYQFMHNEAPKILPIARAIRENAVDLVHINNSLQHGKPSIMAARLTHTPCVCHVRWFSRLDLFDRIFAPLVDTFIYISSAVAEHYLVQGICRAKGIIIHNALDLGEFSTDIDPASVREEYGWTADESIVGVVGRLDWWKGHEYFLQAVAEVARQDPTLRGLIVGEPQDSPTNREYYQKLLSLRESLGLADKVVFAGFRSDVPRLLSAMDVVVLSSSSPEPFGRVVIEGMAAGKPVVATAAGGVLDIIEDGIDGVLVPPQDAEAMAAAIADLVSDREKAKRIGLAARRRVEEKFTLQCQISAMRQLYDGLLDVAKPGHTATGPGNSDREASLPALPDARSGGR